MEGDSQHMFASAQEVGRQPPAETMRNRRNTEIRKGKALHDPVGDPKKTRVRAIEREP